MKWIRRTDWLQAFTSSLRMLILAGALATVAAAQTPPAAAAQTKTPLRVQPSTLSQAIPDQLGGVDAKRVVRWMLRDAIMAALQKNPDIEVARQNVRLAQYDILAAQGFYDPVASSTLFYNSQKTPNVSPFSGSSQNFVQNNTLAYDFGYSQQVERTGGNYQVTFNNSRVTSNASSLATSYSPLLTATLTQPLMRNFSIDANRYLIQINKKKLDLSDAQFRQQVIQIIATVQQAYWDLAFAIRNEEIQRDSLKLAEKQLSDNQEQARVGTLAQLDVVNAAAQVETVRQQVFQAMQTVAQAQDTLKSLTVQGPADELWTANLAPAEAFELKPFTLSLAEALKLALANRPEVRQFAVQKQMNEIDVKFFRNQTRPEVDLIASYSVVGVAGSAATSLDQNGVPQAAAVPPQFVGGYFTALGTLVKNSFPTWRAGVSVSLPLRNRTAQANLGSALETGRQLDTQLRKQLQSIEVDVRNAYHALEATRLQYGAARTAREYAEQQLLGEQQKFAAGLSTTFLVLQRQTELAQARGNEAQTLTNYTNAIAAMQLAISSTLTDNNIQIQSGEDNPMK